MHFSLFATRTRGKLGQRLQYSRLSMLVMIECTHRHIDAFQRCIGLRIDAADQLIDILSLHASKTK